MVKKLQVELAKFKYGETSEDISSYNANSNYYEGAKKLLNLLVDNLGNISRRLPTKYLQTLNNQEINTIESFESNNNIFLFLNTISTTNPVKGKIIIYSNNIKVKVQDLVYSNTNKAEDEVFKYSYNNDTLYMFALSLGYTLNLTDSNYTLNKFRFADGPYSGLDNSGSTIKELAKPSYVGTMLTQRVQLSLPIASQIYSTNDRFIRALQSGVWVVLEAIGVPSNNELLCIPHAPFIDSTPTSTFKLGVNPSNRPNKSTVYFDRFVVAYNKNYIALSSVNDFSNFTDTVRRHVLGTTPVVADTIVDSNSFSFSVPNGKKINWLASSNDGVIIGMKAGVFLLSTLKTDEKLSPLNYKVNKLFNTKCGEKFAYLDNSIVFSDVYEKSIYNITFSSDKSINIEEINTYCKHLFNSKIKKIITTDYKTKIIWIVLANGTLLSASVVKEASNNFYSFAKHSIGGDNAEVIDITTTFNATTAVIYLIVSRKHNNTNNITLETIDLGADDLQICYLDGFSAFTLNGNVLDNLNYYNNSNVTVVIDNINLGVYKVVDNKIYLPSSYVNAKVFIGYTYSSEYATPSVDYTNVTNNLQSLKQIAYATIKLNSNCNFLVYDESNNKFLTSVTANNSLVCNFAVQSSWVFNPSIKLIQNLHYPLNINYVKLSVLLN